jgi:hypothetical protein
MKFFIDTANVEDIRKANDMGVICGVTTNPSLIAKEGRDSGGADQEVYYDWLIINANFPYERLQGGGVNEDEAGLL